jgi:hypothetical protein
MKFESVKIVKICLMIQIKFLAKKVFVLKFYFATIILVRIIMRKGKDSDPEPDPDPGDPKHTDPMDPDLDSEHCWTGRIMCS